MKQQLHEFTKDQLIEIVQDYQEMVSDIESTLNEFVSDGGLDPWCGTAVKSLVYGVRDALQKERPGWKIYENESLNQNPNGSSGTANP